MNHGVPVTGREPAFHPAKLEGLVMSLLQNEPPGPVKSADELMAIAHAMEQEAGRRYRTLAERMRIQGETGLAELFEFLCHVEGKHAEDVAERSRNLTGRLPDPARIRWELPEKFDDEDASSYLLTPYRALAIAVRNEERAFAFFCYMASNSASPGLRELAEQLASDELAHAALLRRERRKAWRAAGRPELSGLPAVRPASVDELLAQSAVAEHRSAAGHRALAAALAATGDQAAAQLFATIAAEEEAGATTMSPGEELRSAVNPAPRTIFEGLRLLEYAFERYSDVAEHAETEAVMVQAQELAQQALKRLTFVRGSLDAAAVGDDHRAP